jgi:hypothetical protein
MFFGFLGLLLFGRFLEQERKGPLIACACSVALAALTRYAGIAFGIAALASLVLQARQERKPRWMMPAIFAAVCFCPIGFWLLRNHFLAGNAINRPLLFHPVLLKDGWPQLIEVLASWVFQEKAFPWSWTVCAALLVVSIGLIWRGKDASRTFARTRTLHILFAGIYLAMLTACFLFLEVDLAPMPFNRILIPLHISWLMLLVVRIDRFAKEPCRRAGAAAKAAVLAALLAYGAFFLWRAGEWIASRRDDSRNYAGARWKTSALLAELREHPRRERMFSNDPAALSLYLNISAYFLPAPNGYAAMVEHVRHGEAVIVLFDGPNDRFPNLHRRLRAEPGLGMLYQSSDGTVYGRRAARTQS